MRARGARRLGMWASLPPFNGGKRRLAGVIFGAIDRVLPRAEWPRLTFVDAFLGGGSVALFAKAQGFGKVLGIDIALRSVVIGEALIANSRVRLTEDVVTRVLAPRSDGSGPVERDLSPQAFTQSQARVIDNALVLARQSQDPAKAALLMLLAIRIALAAHPFSYARKGMIGKLTTGEYETITPTALPQYVRGLRLASFPQLWDLAERINQGVFEGCGDMLDGDALEILPKIEPDVVYADPPYAATRGYEAAYKVIDQILGEKTRPTSPFTAQGGARMIDVLLERTKHVPLVVLSFGNETVSLQELEQKMVQRGRETRAIEIPYARLAALSKGEKSGRDRELLVLGWDPESALLRTAACRRSDLLVPLHPDVDLASAEGSASLTLSGDGMQQGHETAPTQLSAVGGGTVEPLQAGVYGPDSILGEAGVDRDGEGVVGHKSVSGRAEGLQSVSLGLQGRPERQVGPAEDVTRGAVVTKDDLGLDGPTAFVPRQAVDTDRERCVRHEPTVAWNGDGSQA